MTSGEVKCDVTDEKQQNDTFTSDMSTIHADRKYVGIRHIFLNPNRLNPNGKATNCKYRVGPTILFKSEIKKDQVSQTYCKNKKVKTLGIACDIEAEVLNPNWAKP